MIKSLSNLFKAFVFYPDDRSKPRWKRRFVAGTITGVAILLLCFVIIGSLLTVEHFFGKIAAMSIAFISSIVGISVAVASEIK